MKPCAAPAPDTAPPEPEPPGRLTAELSQHGVTRVGWRVGKRSTRRVLARVAASPPCRATRLFGTGRARSALGSAQRSNPVMKIGAALAADLGILTEALDEPGTDVLHSLHQLGVDAQAAVPTYLGLSMTVDGGDPPFTFTTLEDGAADDVRTSVRLTLPGVGDARASPSVALTLYAETPGTFVALTADLAWLTGGRPRD